MKTSSISSDLDAAVRAIQEHASVTPKIGIILGSGLANFVQAVDVTASLSYEELPGFLASTVEGHPGKLVLGGVSGTPVAIMQGRIHRYEGYEPAHVVFPVRVLIQLGVETLIVTNASGSVNPDFDAPELMLITDHLNLTGGNPLVGPNEAALGPRFPDMTDAYDPGLAERARKIARGLGNPLLEGIYAGLLGPSYETPAEIRMLRTLGADAVGMSTVFEVIAARHMGARVLGISCISNKGAGLSTAKLDHSDVKSAAAAVEDRFVSLLQGIIADLNRA